MPVFKFAVLLVVVAYSQVNLMSLLDTVTLAFWLILNILFLTGSASVKDTLSNFFNIYLDRSYSVLILYGHYLMEDIQLCIHSYSDKYIIQLADQNGIIRQQ